MSKLIITFMDATGLHTILIDEDEMMWYIKNTTVYSCRTPAIYS
jgi:hypothetical protein